MEDLELRFAKFLRGRSLHETLARECQGGKLDNLKHVCTAANVTSETIRQDNNHILYIACRYGHFEIVQWLVETFNLTRADLARFKDLLHLICGSGCLPLVKWLHSKFEFTGEEVRAKENSALRISLIGCNFEMVKWLATTFKLSIADYLDVGRDVRELACERGKINENTVVEWFQCE